MFKFLKFWRNPTRALIKVLKEKDETISANAADSLGELGDPRAVEPLIKTLQGGYKSAQIAAAKALGKLGDPSAVEPLIEKLSSKYWEPPYALREAVAEALGALGDKRAIEPLIGELVNNFAGSAEGRKLAALSLAKLGEPKWAELIAGNPLDTEQFGNCGDPRVVEPLINLLVRLDSYGDAKRVQAAEALGMFGDLRAVEPLINLLNKRPRSMDSGKAAIRALGQLGDKRAVDVLITEMGVGGFKYESHQLAAEALGKIGDPRAVEPLIKEMGYTRVGIEALSKMGDPRVPDALIAGLCVDDHDARQAATEGLKKLGEPKWAEIVKGYSIITVIRRLGDCGDERVINPLKSYLEDRNIHVSEAAAAALTKLSNGTFEAPETDKDTTDDLMLMKRMEENTFRRKIIQAFRELDDPGSFEMLIAELEQSKSREETFEAIERSGDRRVIEQLIMLLCEYDTEVRKCAADALAILGETKWAEIVQGDALGNEFKELACCDDPRAIRSLIKALKNKEEHARFMAAMALGISGKPDAVEPLIEALKDGDLNVLESAAKALGKLGDKRAVDPLTQANERLQSQTPHDDRHRWDLRDACKVTIDALAKLSETN